jgi:hypothetical protein
MLCRVELEPTQTAAELARHAAARPFAAAPGSARAKTCDGRDASPRPLPLVKAGVTSLGPSRVRGKGSSSRTSTDRGSSVFDKLRRKRVGRPSRRLTLHQVRNAFSAAEHAIVIGLPLNRFVTINWQLAGAATPVTATGRFLKLARDWLRRLGAASAHIWVQECGRQNGLHAHLLIHVPPEFVRRFSHLQRRWLSAAGAEFRKGVIRSRPIGRSYRHALVGRQYGEEYRSDLSRALQYVLKESDQATRAEFDLRFSPKGGLVHRKRLGTSQNIGAAVRAAQGLRQYTKFAQKRTAI